MGPEKRKRGRPKNLLGDLMIGAVITAMEDDHSNDALSDREGLAQSGLFVGNVPRAYSLRRAMLSTDLRDELIKANQKIVNLVLKEERWFHIDATVMSTPYYEKWITVLDDDGKPVLKKIVNTKVYLARARATGVIVAVMIADDNNNDQPFFIPMMEQIFAHGGSVNGGGVATDAGFNKREHYEYVYQRGGRAFLDFDNGAKHSGGKYPHYDEQFAHYHSEDKTYWNAFYDSRVLSESLNQAIKTPIKEVLMSRLEITRENEVRALVLAYNLGRIPELRSKFKVELPFADEQALALVDRAVRRKRRAPTHYTDVHDDPRYLEEMARIDSLMFEFGAAS